MNKGTHKAVDKFRKFARKAGRNNTKTCWALKCDIKKFFANIDHDILLNILREYITNDDVIGLLANIVKSFEVRPNKGIPLGNLTSQLFANFYLNELDQFIKHKLRIKYYARYADDFVFLSPGESWLKNILIEVRSFLRERLKLQLHPDKISIRTVASGVDFLGWINFPHCTVLRTKTKRRMMSRLEKNPAPESLASYWGLLKYGNTFKLQQELRNNYWLRENKIYG